MKQQTAGIVARKGGWDELSVAWFACVLMARAADEAMRYALASQAPGFRRAKRRCCRMLACEPYTKELRRTIAGCFVPRKGQPRLFKPGRASIHCSGKGSSGKGGKAMEMGFGPMGQNASRAFACAQTSKEELAYSEGD